MIRQNLHTHTCFCDGQNTPMEMAQAALEAHLTSLGFSGHSDLPWDNDWGMTPEKVPAYRAAVAETKAAFAGRLEVFCGLEWDAVSLPETAGGYDYVIGSVHHIDMGGEYPSVDDTPEVSKAALAKYFAGDADAMAEAYFAQYAELAAKPFVDIVGHFDLLTKYDERHSLFDDASRRYTDAAMAGMELLLKAGKLFEVNTGAMARGWRTAPYPSPRLLAELKARNAHVLVTSDAHSADAVAYAFADMEALLRAIGFREIWELTDRGFVPLPLV